MTLDEAIQWATAVLSSEHEHWYYTSPENAQKAADALTTLSGQAWEVKTAHAAGWKGYEANPDALVVVRTKP